MWRGILLLHNGLTLQLIKNTFDAPPNSLKDSNVNPKVKIIKERVWVHFLACSISGVRRACWSFRMGTRTSDKWVNCSYGPTQTKQQVG
jgi:hypothetical protein